MFVFSEIGTINTFGELQANILPGQKRNPASELSTRIIYTSKRISDPAINVKSITIVLHDFRDHISPHFVEED